jgi:hypothetical protein
MVDVKVQTPAGDFAKVKQEDLRHALTSGYKLATPAMEAQYVEEKKYDSPVTAAALGMGSSVLPFASDAIAEGMGVDVGKYYKYNPNARMVGEVAGFLVPWGAAGRASKYAAKLARGIKGVDGAATVGRTVAAAAAAGVVEGGASALSRYVSDATVGNIDLNAEQAFSKVLTGAALGGGIGGSLGLLGYGARSAANRVVNGETATKLREATKLPAARSEVIRKFTTAIDDVADTLTDLSARVDDIDWGKAINKVADAQPPMVMFTRTGQMTRELQFQLTKMVDDPAIVGVARSQAKRMLDSLTKSGGAYRNGAGETWNAMNAQLKMVSLIKKPPSYLAASIENGHRLLSDVDTFGSAVSLRNDMLASTTKFRPAGDNFKKAFQTDVASEFGARAVADPGKVAKFLREAVDDPNSLEFKHLQDWLREAEAHVGQADAALGGSSGKAVKKSLSLVRNALEESSKHNELDKWHSAGASGGLFGGANAGIPWIPGLNGAYSLAMGMGRVVNFMQSGGVSRAMAGKFVAFHDQYAAGIGRVVTNIGAKSVTIGARAAQPAVTLIGAATKNDPIALASASSSGAMTGFDSVVPDEAAEIKEAMRSVSDRWAAVVGSKSPIVANGNPFLPPSQATRTELLEYGKMLSAIREPMETIRDYLQDGKPNSTGMDTIKKVMPNLHADMETKVLDKLLEMAENGKRPPYKTRVRAGLAFGQKTDGFLDVRIAEMMRKYYAPIEKEKKGKRRGRDPELSSNNYNENGSDRTLRGQGR